MACPHFNIRNNNSFPIEEEITSDMANTVGAIARLFAMIGMVSVGNISPGYRCCWWKSRYSRRDKLEIMENRLLEDKEKAPRDATLR